MLRKLGRSHTRLLSAALSAPVRVTPPTRAFNSEELNKDGVPFTRNQKAMEEWMKTLNDPTLKSPFHKIAEPRETATDTLFRAFETNESAYPNVPAMIDVTRGGTTLTYADLRKKAKSLGGFLQSRGFAKNGRAAIAMGNSFEWIVNNMGVWAAGGTIIGTSSSFTPFEMEQQFDDSKVSVILTSEALLPTVLKATANNNIVKTIICARSTENALPDGVIDLAEACEHPPLETHEKVDLEDPALIFYSSGTTGAPKGTVISHRAINALIHMTPSHWENEIYPCLNSDKLDWHKEHQLICLPFYHILGFGLVNWFLKVGAPTVVMGSFDPVAYLSAIQQFKPRFLIVVPPILLFLAKHPVVAKFDLSSIELVITGAAAAGKDLTNEFGARFPKVKFVSQGYGMTECGFTHLPILKERTDASVGIVASLCEQKIIDPNTGKPVGLGERGEILVRGSTLMTEYLNQPEATAETIDKEGWLHTGDIAYMENDGRVNLVDRLKELIKVKGFQVAPAELEDLLLSHPLIADVAIIGVPDDKVGERVRAFVVRKDKGLEADEVRNFVAEKLSDHKHITGGVKFVKEIPKSAAGKILRRVLRDKTAKASNKDEDEE